MNESTSARRLIAAAVGAVTLATLTACGGSSGSTSPSASAPVVVTPTTSAAPDLAAYRDCMATNGVTLPGLGARPSGMPTALPSGPPPSGASGGGFPGGLPDGVDQSTFDAAQTACASLRPQGGPGGPGPGAVDASALAAFTSCLADHDVTMPTGADGVRRLDRSDPTVKAAMDICSPLLPALTSP